MSNSTNDAKPSRLEPVKRAIALRDFDLARRLLSKQVQTEAEPIDTWLMLASVCRAAGRLSEALSVLDRALSREPRHFLGLLMRASVLDRLGRSEAPEAYGVALELMPDVGIADLPTQAAIERARRVHGAYVGERKTRMMTACETLVDHGVAMEKWRTERFIDDALRLKKRFRQDPAQFFYPGLPAIEFYNRSYFPWLDELESHWKIIRDELIGILDANLSGFTPYIQYPDRLPLDQWRELNRNPDWSAFHLIEGGQIVADNAVRCPRTLSALSGLPQPQIAGRGPAAMFSALKSHTRIPPHTGVSNTRLVVHLPLIVPENCGFRVGNEVQSWVPGKALVFDDSIEHEAWNDSDEVRVILIFDVWSPFLSPQQQAAIVAIMRTMDGEQPSVPSAQPLDEVGQEL